ncbi:MAG: RNA-binding protein, partial [Sphingobacteriales bacterium]
MNLFIGNLSPTTSEDNLRKAFAEFGNVLSVKIPIDNATGLPRGFGFVEMEDKFHAYDAIDNLDTTYMEGNIISVKESKPKTQAGGGGGFNRGGTGGNRGGGFNRGGGGGGYNRDRNGSGGGYNREGGSAGGY